MDPDVNTQEIEFTEVTAEETAAMIAVSGSRKKFHFYPRTDIAMLRQVLHDRPFDSPHGKAEERWSLLASKLRKAGITAEARTIRDHFAILVKKFRADEMQSLRKSGTDEEYTEREQLLTEVVEILDGLKTQSKENKEAEIVSTVLINQLRDSAMKTLKEKRAARKDGESEPSTSRSLEEDGETTLAGAKKRSLRGLIEDRNAHVQRQLDNERLRLENEAKRIKLDEDRLKIEDKKVEIERSRANSEAESRKLTNQLLVTLVHKLGNQ